MSDGTTTDVKITSTHMDLPDLLIPRDQELVADVVLILQAGFSVETS